MMRDAQQAAEARVRQAYDTVLATLDGQIVVEDILLHCFHMAPTSNHDEQVLQQFALRFLRRAGLFPENVGSFPLKYVQALQRLKDQAPDPIPEPPTRAAKKGTSLLARILGRKF